MSDQKNISIDLPNWRHRSDSELRVQSALVLARAALEVREQLLPLHLRETLSNAIWKYTECDGNYSTRFRSRGAIEFPKEKLNHEHVLTRKLLIAQLLENPDDYISIMQTAVGCTVLRTEHLLLGSVEKENPSLVGWDRYREAGIEVYDLKTRSRFI